MCQRVRTSQALGGGCLAGWVYRVQYPPSHPASPLLEEDPRSTQRSGPGRPRGPGVVGCGVRTYLGDGGRGRVLYHPPGPVGPTLWALPVQDPWNAHLRPKGRDLGHISVKLVKTVRCHQNMSKRPPLVPILKTRSKSHLLIFSDFRFCEPSLTRN